MIGYFISLLPEEISAKIQDSSSLETRLNQLWEATQHRWPNISVDSQAFFAHLARRLPLDQPLEQFLKHLKIEDLYLAFACSQGNPQAIAEIEREYFPVVEAAIKSHGQEPDAVEELKQSLREHLFVTAPPHGEPLILSFSGMGHLRRWLQVIAIRESFHYMKRLAKECPVEGNLIDALPSPRENQELNYLKQKYSEDFKAAFSQALKALESRSRNLIRQHYIDGLNIDKIGRLYRVHRATAARWIVKARELLLKETHAAFMQRVKVNRADYASIMRLIKSQLYVTLQNLEDK